MTRAVDRMTAETHLPVVSSQRTVINSYIQLDASVNPEPSVCFPGVSNESSLVHENKCSVTAQLCPSTGQAGAL